MAEVTETVGFNDDYNVTIVANRSDIDRTDPASTTARDVIWYVVLALGVPGNLLESLATCCLQRSG